MDRRWRLVWLLLLYLVVAMVPFCHALTRSYQNCIELRQEEEHGMTMRLHWTIREEDGGNSGNGGSDNRTIELALESSATGWSAIGLSTDGTMTSSGRGSDIMLGWISDPVVREEGEISPEGPARRQEAEEDCSSGCLHDYWVERKFPTPPVRMDEQWGEGGRADLLLVAAEESDGMTSEWDRALDTGDTVADRVIDPSVETFVIFAAHRDVKPESSRSFRRHTRSTNSRVSIQFDQSYKCPGIAEESFSADSMSASSSSFALDPLASNDASTSWSSPSSSSSSWSSFDDSASSHRDLSLARYLMNGCRYLNNE